MTGIRRDRHRTTSDYVAPIIIEKNTIHHNVTGIWGEEADARPRDRIIDNRILNNQTFGIFAFDWFPRLFKETSLCVMALQAST